MGKSKTLDELRADFRRLYREHQGLIDQGVLPDPRKPKPLWDKNYCCPAIPVYDPHAHARARQ